VLSHLRPSNGREGVGARTGKVFSGSSAVLAQTLALCQPNENAGGVAKRVCSQPFPHWAPWFTKSGASAAGHR
jgi:hypothetical protein